MQRISFVLVRNTEDDAGRKNPDPIGNFTCTWNTAKFLDIEKLGKVYIPDYEVNPKKPSSKIRATGEIVRGEKNTDGINTKSKRKGRASLKGSRSIRLFTGKPNSSSTIKPTYCTIGFRFPSMATVAVIADSLGTLIPAGKISSSPSASEIRPIFKIVGGGSYGILTASAAAASTAAEVPITDAAIAALAAKKAK